MFINLNKNRKRYLADKEYDIRYHIVRALRAASGRSAALSGHYIRNHELLKVCLAQWILPLSRIGTQDQPYVW